MQTIWAKAQLFKMRYILWDSPNMDKQSSDEPPALHGSISLLSLILYERKRRRKAGMVISCIRI